MLRRITNPWILLTALLFALVASPAAAAPMTIDLADFHLIDNNADEDLGVYFDIDFDGDGVVDINLYHQFLFDEGMPVGSYSDVIGGPSCVSGCGAFPLNAATFGMYLDPVYGDAAFAAPAAGAFDEPSSFAEYAMFFDSTLNELYENPWLALDSFPAYLTGLFDISGSTHQFFVQLSVDTDDGSLILESAGYETNPVPEPTSLWLLGGGLVLVAARLRRRPRGIRSVRLQPD